MPNLLGLTLNANNIGWTILHSSTKKIKAMGCHVFPVGCINFGSGRKERSKQSFRRLKRIARVALARKRKRKIKVLQLLIANAMCPLEMEALKKWQQTKIFPDQALKEWFKMNPYTLRKKGLSHPLSLQELGRILYQITSHRGFPTKFRQGTMSESAINTGIPASERLGILHTKTQLANNTLGVYLEGLLPEEGASYMQQKERIRNRFLDRVMFQEEMHLLWNYQSKFHEELTEELKHLLIGKLDSSSKETGAVFYQRPLKSQKFRVGKCEYEKRKTKCCQSDLTYQEMLAYQWANQIKKNGVYLNSEERHSAAYYYLTNKRFPFKRFKITHYNQENSFNFKDDEIINGSFIHATLSQPKLFGEEWFAFSEAEKETLWHKLYFFDNKDKLQDNLMTKHQLSFYQAKHLSLIKLDRSYTSISKKAAANILYFLKKGLVYNMAVILGGVKSCLQSSWESIAPNDVDYIIKTVSTLYKTNKGTAFTKALTQFLSEEMGINQVQLSKLYGVYGALDNVILQPKFEVGNNADIELNCLRVPLLKTVMFELRKLLNTLIDTYGSIDVIRATLDIDLKINKHQRYLHGLDQKRLARLRQSYMQELGARAENITPLNLTKYELWKESKNTCPYTGKHISLEALFSDQFKVVYIQPWASSLNDSMLNKVLCEANFANQINDKTPLEYFQENAPEQWEGVVKRAARLFSNTKEFPVSYKKFKRFVKRYNKRKIFKHLMDDPNAVSRKVQHYLERVVPEVTVSAGYTDGLFIEKWQLKNILAPSVYEQKDLDWRFAALTAYVSANREEEYFDILTAQNKYLPQQKRQNLPIPYAHFREDLSYHLNGILVSHKKESKLISVRKKRYKMGSDIVFNTQRSVRGSLHKESVYGLRKRPNSALSCFHIRKPVESIQTMKQLDKVVDPVVKSILLKTLLNNDHFIGTTIPKHSFSGFDLDGEKFYKAFLPNAKGDPVPIKKVRIRENFTGTTVLKTGLNQHVNLRNNHHVLIYKDVAGNLQEQMVTFWEAVQRARRGEPIYKLPPDGASFVTTLEINDMFLLGLKNHKDLKKEKSKELLSKHLYRVQKLSSFFYEFRLAYDNNLKNLEMPAFIRINNFGHRKTGWATYNPAKVKVNLAGQWKIVRPTLKQKTSKWI